MDNMEVAYEDDIPKNRGPKVPGHCARDTRLGAPILLRHTVYIYSVGQKKFTIFLNSGARRRLTLGSGF